MYRDLAKTNNKPCTISKRGAPVMFKKKSSFRGATKGVGSMQTGSFSPESGVADSPTLPRPPPTAIPKKVEAPKPSTPASIVPPGTKRVLVVGKYVVMTADVDSCDAVIVQGNLDGNIKAKYIVIMKGVCFSTDPHRESNHRPRDESRKPRSIKYCKMSEYD